MSSRYFGWSSLLAMAVSLCFASCAQAATYTVTTTTDGGPGSLRQAIIDANAHAGADTVTVAAETFERTLTGDDSTGATPAATGDLDISDDLTLAGPGSSVGFAIITASAPGVPNGSATDRVFEITGGAKVTIDDISINGGRVLAGEPNPGGGGIKVTDGELTLNDSFVTQSTAVGAGGGILLMKGKLTTNDTYIANNTSETSTGGGIAHPAGGSASTSITLTNTALNQNHADAQTGGGIADLGPGTLTLTRSYVTRNTANSGGGISASGDVTKIVDTYFEGNQAGAGSSTAPGGGILIQGGGTLELDRSLLTANQAGIGAGLSQQPGGAPATILNSTFSTNVAQSSGGAIRTAGDGATVTNSTFADNTAPSGSALVAATGVADHPITLINSIVSGDAQNCAAGKIVSGGHNLDSGTSCPFTEPGDLRSTDAKLGPLQSFEQNDHHHPLLVGSPAIDAADSAHCPTVDSRRLLRDPAACDMGAYEATPATDTIAPTTAIGAAAPPPFGSTAPGGGFVGTVELTVSADDPRPSGGGVTTRCVLDPLTVPTSYDEISALPGCPATLTTPGVHHAYAASIDAAGNKGAVATTTFTIVFSPDTTITKAPTEPITTAPTFEFIADVSGATFECAVDGIDGSAFKGCTSPLTLPEFPDGEYLLRVRAILGGIRDPVSASANFRIDRVAPTASIAVSPGQGGARVGERFTGPVALDVGATDPDPASGVAQLRCVLDVGFGFAAERFDQIPATSCPTTVDAVGFHSLYAAAIDKAGNVGPVVHREFTILPVPDTTVTSGVSGDTWLTANTFEFQSSIPGSTFVCSTDIGSPQACSSPHRTRPLAVGAHRLEVTAVSPDGVADPTPAVRTFTIGATKVIKKSCVIESFQHWFHERQTGGPTFPLDHCLFAERPASCDDGWNASSCPGDLCTDGWLCNWTPDRCPVGATCTVKVKATFVHGDEGIEWSAGGEVSFQTMHQRFNSNSRVPSTTKRCSIPAGRNGCSVTYEITRVGTGAPVLAICSAGPAVLTRDDKLIGTLGPDSDRRLECQYELTIKSSTALQVVGGLGTDVALSVPGSGRVTLSPGIAGSKKSALDASVASRLTARPTPDFKPLTANVTEAGPVSFTLKLSASAKKRLKKAKKLALTFAVKFIPADGSAPTTSTTKITIRTPAKPPAKCKTSKRKGQATQCQPELA